MHDICFLLFCLESRGSEPQVGDRCWKMTSLAFLIHLCMHIHSLSHTHIYGNLMLIEKLFPSFKFLQGTFQKPKGKKFKSSEVRNSCIFKQQKGRYGMRIPSVLVCSALLCCWRIWWVLFMGLYMLMISVIGKRNLPGTLWPIYLGRSAFLR